MDYRFCPYCGHALKMPSGEKEKSRCSNCYFVHYNNPKACVSAIIQRRNEILFVQRAHEPFKHYWDFPGGFLEAGESPEAGLRREVREELQIEIEIYKLLGAYSDTYGPGGESVLVVYYICKTLSNSFHPREEIADAKWFERRRMPHELAFNHLLAVLADWEKYSKRLLANQSAK